MRVALGKLSTLEPGRARVVGEVIVVLSKDGVRAYRNECKHLPAPLNPGGGVVEVSDALVCRSHGARYTLEEGLCFSGPCRGKFLDPIAIEQVGDELFALVRPA
jgi:nitrite reductase/ring-hydroxylating ferredoxin subunit